MLKCPKCSNKIPFYKPWFLTNYSHITCASCGEKLYANRKINSRIGGIGGFIGVIIGTFFNFKFGFWMWIIIIPMFLCILLALTVFTKFEVKG